MRFPTLPSDGDPSLELARICRSEGYDTVIVLPLPDGPRGDEIHADMLEQIKDLPTSALLFCRHLTRVVITGDYQRTWNLLRQNHDGRHTVALEQDGATEPWHVYRTIMGVTHSLCRRSISGGPASRFKGSGPAISGFRPDAVPGRGGRVPIRHCCEIRENISHKERARKIRNISLPELQASWDAQLTPEEKTSLRHLTTGQTAPTISSEILAKQAVSWAEEHLLERRSVVREHELWRHALEHARGQNIELADVQAVTRQRGYLRDEKHPGKVTTKELLRREWEIVCMARDGIGRFGPYCSGQSIQNSKLDAEQRQAVERILRSKDFVTLFRGGAGTGKSYTLREVYGALQQAGRMVTVIAPQRQQVMDLERDGFRGAQTVSGFLARGILSRGCVVLVDEAGQIGGRQMHQLLRLAQANQGRVILSGDTRQHGAVEASDAMRAIEKYSTLRAIELTEIRRQDPARAKTRAERERIAQYREAVKEASAGNLDASFNRLDRQGAIVMCLPSDQEQRLAQSYLAFAVQHSSVVVVSQTWSEIHRVNEQVRAALKSRGLLGAEDRAVTTLETVDLTEAQKRDRRFYKEDTVIVLNRKVAGLEKGRVCQFVDITEKGIVLKSADQTCTIPFRFADRLTVCQPKELMLAAGDRLQLKANAKTRAGQRLANGELVSVKKVSDDGRITLRDGRVLQNDYRQFVRGFAITSYASQGKTVDHVLFSDSAIKAATNQQQWYVTISRGRKGIQIFTGDKGQLRENILRSGNRELAIDLAKQGQIQRPDYYAVLPGRGAEQQTRGVKV